MFLYVTFAAKKIINAIARIKMKEEATRRIEKYNSSDYETKLMLKDGIDITPQ